MPSPSGPAMNGSAIGAQTVAAAASAAATSLSGGLGDGRLDRREPAVPLDELLGELMRLVILDLNGR